MTSRVDTGFPWHALRMPLRWPVLMAAMALATPLSFLWRWGTAMPVVVGLAALVLLVPVQICAHVLLEAAAEGEHRAPPVSLELLDSWWQPVNWCIPVLAVALAAVGLRLPPLPAVLLWAAMAFAWPWVLAAMMLKRATTGTPWPAHAANVARALGTGGLALGSAATVVVVAVWKAGLALPWPPLPEAILVWLVFALHTLTGAVMYAARGELGYEARRAPERAAAAQEQQRQQRQQRLDHMLDDVYVAVRVRSEARARAALASWFEVDGAPGQAGDLRQLLQRARHWPAEKEVALAADLALEQSCRLGARQISQELLRMTWERLPAYRPRDGVLRDQLARESRDLGMTRTADRLAGPP